MQQIRIDDRSLRRALRALSSVYPPAWVGQQLRRSMNREINRTHRELVKKAGPITGLQAKFLRKRVGKFAAKKGRPGGNIWVTKRSAPIAAGEWTIRKTKTGVRVRGRQGAGTQDIAGGFIWTPPGASRKQVFRRRGRSRLPIEKVFLDPRVSDVIRKYGRGRMRGANLRIWKHMRPALKKRAARQSRR